MIVSSYGAFGLTAMEYALRMGIVSQPASPIQVITSAQPRVVNMTPVALPKIETAAPPSLNPFDPANMEQPVSLCPLKSDVWDAKSGKCVPYLMPGQGDAEYLQALKAQGAVELAPDGIPPALIWAGVLGAIGFVIWRRRRAAPMQGYRRRRRRK